MRNFNGPSKQRGFFGDLISGFFAKKATDKQVQGQREAIAEQRRASEAVRADLAPFRQAGEQVLQPLVDMALAGADFSRAEDRSKRDLAKLSASFRNPAFQGTSSGGFGAGIHGLTLDFIEGTKQTNLDNLFRLASMGGNAAAGQATGTLQTSANIGNLQSGIGATRAAGMVNLGNAASSGFQSFLGNFLESDDRGFFLGEQRGPG